jgi:beta-lactamase regulating signal transducer with metallopeptidase domain
MTPLLQIVLSNAVMATALAIVVFTIAWIARRPALAHVLWLLVLIKLITPGVIPLPVSWQGTREASSEPDTASISLAAPSASATDVVLTSEPPQEVTLLIYPDPDLAGSDSPADEAVANTSTPGYWQNLTGRTLALWPWVAPLWLAGSALWLIWTGVQVYRFNRLLRHARLAPDKLQDEVKHWSEKLGLRKPPTLWLVPSRISPMLWTLGRSPRLLFPAMLLDRLDAEQRSALLVHELAHLRRRDHWVRFLELAVMAIYWWHPVVWWARRELHEAEEQCCDAWVVWALTLEWRAELREQPGGERGCGRSPSAPRRAYALALLHTVDFFSHARPTLPAPASGVGQVPHLQRRLTMIMNGNTSKSLSAAGWLAVGAFSLLLPLVPLQAQQPSQDDRNDPRDQQIQQLKKALQAIEDQQATKAKRAAEFLHSVKEQETQAQRAEQQAQEQVHIIRLQEAQLAQSQDAEQRVRSLRGRLADDKGNPDAQKIERMIEEITRAIEVKRQELRGLEEKLQFARADLEKMRAEGARAEVELRLKARDAETHREPIILRIDPNVSPEQIKAQVEALQGKIKQPIRVEIVSPEKGPVRARNRIETGADARPERRDVPRGQNLEEKLERIMKEVEELRRELRSSRQQPTP